MLCDTERRKALYGGQTDADAVAQLYVDLNNAVIDCVPRGMVVNTHICRGNYHSTWASSGGYAPVSKILFGQERVDGYYLEFDDERSGGFEPLADVTGDKIVVLGLITSKRPSWRTRSTSRSAFWKPPSMCRWTGSACRPSAVLPPLRRATSSLRRISGRSWL